MRPRADTLLVWTGAACSYGCGACPIDPERAPAGVRVTELQQRLATVSGQADRLVVLVGGEPFLRKDFHRLLAAVRAAGCAPGIVTTGRALVYPQVREQLRRAGLAYVRIQLFGCGATHDHATNVPGAFDQALAGLRAWIAEAPSECDADVALSIRRRPLDTIVSEVEAVLRALPSSNVQLVIALQPECADEQYDDAVRRAVAAFAHCNEDVSHALLAWEGLPASAECLTIRPLPQQFILRAPTASCLGAAEELVDAAAVSREETCANSFNFVRTATTVPCTAAAEACSAYAAAGGIEACRQLWLVEGERLVLHVTDTADFAPADIARVKDDLSHLFVDRAPLGVLDDFMEGMRRALPDVTCDTCTNRPSCGRRFRVVAGPPFAHEEAWIAEYITALRGRVLDVGCGEQLYRAQLTPLIRGGAVQYTGLDPDEVSLAQLRAALPEGRFHSGGIEDFRDAAASYDHILCLRSLNHVTDVDEALARMAVLLKPGGFLLLAECTPFAMLRRPEQVTAADRAPRAGQQHLRNLSSDEVMPFVRRRSLRVVHHRPATLQNTNEWILLLTRAPASAA